MMRRFRLAVPGGLRCFAEPKDQATYFSALSINELPRTLIISGSEIAYLHTIANGPTMIRPRDRRETMKTMLRIALTALSIASIAPAYAGDGDGYSATTTFTTIANQQAHVPAPGRIVIANPNGGAAFHAYATSTRPAGTWLFPPAAGIGN
jgi:hypothetical protein